MQLKLRKKGKATERGAADRQICEANLCKSLSAPMLNNARKSVIFFPDKRIRTTEKVPRARGPVLSVWRLPQFAVQIGLGAHENDIYYI